jgi:hypothetical protein
VAITAASGSLSVLWTAREGRPRQHDPIVAIERSTERIERRLVVCVVAVEERDQDVGIEDGQSHSSRKRASSSGSNAPVTGARPGPWSRPARPMVPAAAPPATR